MARTRRAGDRLIIGSDVTVGHRVTLHACTIGNACLIGMGAILLDNVVTEDLVMIGAGTLVPPGKVLQKGGLYVGSPAKRVRDLTEKEIAFLTYSAAHYVKVKDEYLRARAVRAEPACSSRQSWGLRTMQMQSRFGEIAR